MLTADEDYLIVWWSVAVLVAYATFVVFKKLYLFTDYSDTQSYINGGVTYGGYDSYNRYSHGLSGLNAAKYREPSSEIFIEEIADEDGANDYSTDELPICSVPLIEEPTDEENGYNGDGIGVRQPVNVEDFLRSDETAANRTVNAYNGCSTMSDDIHHLDESGEANSDDEFSNDTIEGQSVNGGGFSQSDEEATKRTVNVYNDCSTMSDDIQNVDESEEANNDDEFSNDTIEGQSVNGERFSRSDEEATNRTVNAYNGCSTMSDDIQYIDESGEPNNDDKFSNDTIERQSMNGEVFSRSDGEATNRTVHAYNDYGANLDDIQHEDKSRQVNFNDEFNYDTSEGQSANGKDFLRSVEVTIDRTVHAYNDCKTSDASQRVDENGHGKNKVKFSNDISMRQFVNMENFSFSEETATRKTASEDNGCSIIQDFTQYKDVTGNMIDNNGLGNHVSDVFPRSDETAADQAVEACNVCSITPDIFQHIDADRVMSDTGEFRNSISNGLSTDVGGILKPKEILVDSITNAYGHSSSARKTPMTKKKLKRFNKSFRKIFCARCVKGVKD